MKTKLIVASLAIIAIATIVIGCSSVTPAPEIIILGVNPAVTSADSAVIRVTMKNMNKVDAIITNSRFTFRGLAGSSQSPVFTHSIFCPGNTDSIFVDMSVTGLTAIRATLGSPVTLWIRFWGTDAFGYNKTFTTDSVAVGCN